MTIDNCVNTGNVAVHALGTTYYGNLTEVNSGTIIRCQVNLPEQFQGTYAGGITGKNTAEGEIIDCVVSGTVIGSRMAGGITAENFGSISTLADVLTMNGDIQSENGCIGGVAGFNAGSVSASEVKVKLSGDTYRAGGIAGINRGNHKRSQSREQYPYIRRYRRCRWYCRREPGKNSRTAVFPEMY